MPLMSKLLDLPKEPFRDGLPLLVLVLLFLRSMVRAWLLPRGIPGPFWARFSRLWYLIQVLRGDFEKTNIELHRRYGPIVRISPYEYSIDDPHALRTIYGHGTKFIKSPWYFASGNPDGKSFDLFTDQSPTRHAANRRKMASLYSTSNLMSMEPCIQECTALLKSNFEKFAANAQPLNIQFWMQCYAFDVIGLITLSRRFGLLDRGEDLTGMLKSLHKYLRYCASVGVFSEVHSWIFKPLMMLNASGLSDMINFTAAQIARRHSHLESVSKSDASEDDDFLGKVIKMNRDNPQKFTSTDVFTTCITNIGAGSDTTSISLTSIIYHLVQAPWCLSKLRAELDEHEAAGTISNPVTFKESQNLSYLQAVIKEALRLHPATGLPLGRVVPKGGAHIAGYYFPENVVVGINTWVSHRNKDVFGEDADTFRPERWLSEDDQTRKMAEYYIPFGHGSRTCIGKNISLMEIGKLIPELIRSFDFSLVYPDEDLVTENVWFVKQTNFHVRVHKRECRD